MTTPSTFWTAEREEALAKYWAERLSQSEIARRLSSDGAPCNKNMVKSKSVRMGLPDREPCSVRRDIPVSERPEVSEPHATHAVHDQRGCRWPHGDPRHWRDKTQFHFCGKRQELGKPYCPDHQAAAYQQIPDKAKRAA